MSELPEKIGKYAVTGIAGKGAMGVVYIGHDPFVDRKVAIKVSTQETDNEDDQAALQARKMFFNEARAAGALDHPNILRVYDAGDADGEPYIVMEFVENADDLKSYCNKEKLLPVKTIVAHVKKCAEALDYAHQHGITHRDIKPANIMLNDKGDVKIVDFGIAQRTKADQTQVMGWFGSPLYMSPEQAKDENITSQSDLFSLGVVTYELLTGVQPFAAKGISGLLNNVLNKDPDSVSSIRSEIPDSLAEVVKNALQKSIDDRYKTGVEMGSDLEKVLADLDNPLLGLSDDEKLARAAALSFFAGFSDPEVKEFVRASKWESHRAGTILVEEGQQQSSLYIVIAGEVTVTRAGKDIAALAEGECFGEMAYLSGEKRSATVTAANNVALMRLDPPLKEWASLPVQMRLNKVFQKILIERLATTSRKLSRQQ